MADNNTTTTALLAKLTDRAAIDELVARGALFVVSHSGGKDSQIMAHLVRQVVPANQILVVHAELDGVEWQGTLEHVENTIGDLPLEIARAVWKDGTPKALLDYIEARGMFPSPQQRTCTSDFKRGPIAKVIRHYLKANPRFGGLVVNCMGLRAQESDARECGLNKAAHKATGEAVTLELSKRNSKAGREWYDWLPIHTLSVDEVFAGIEAAGQDPHWAYGAGMSRLSCCFCIMASDDDLRIAAQHNPELYKRYVELEQRIGHTMRMDGTPLEQVTGIRVAGLNARAA